MDPLKGNFCIIFRSPSLGSDVRAVASQRCTCTCAGGLPSIVTAGNSDWLSSVLPFCGLLQVLGLRPLGRTPKLISSSLKSGHRQPKISSAVAYAGEGGGGSELRSGCPKCLSGCCPRCLRVSERIPRTDLTIVTTVNLSSGL